MNTNIISQLNLAPREGNQGGTGTSETTFSTDGTIPAILKLPSSAQLCGVGGQKLSATFKVIACGRVTTGASFNVTIKMYFGTSLTPGSNTAIATTGAVSVATTSQNWRLEAVLTWDSTSNRINGWYAGHLGATVVTPTTITNAIASADPDGGTPLGFAVTFTLATGNASNTVNLDWFVIVGLD